MVPAVPARRISQSFAERATAFAQILDRHDGLCIAVTLLVSFVVILGQSARKLLWYDELITVRTASLPGFHQIWNFYARGLDTTSPTPSLIVHAALKLPFGPEIDSRLPFSLGFLLMLGCMYVFMRRRYSSVYALPAILFPILVPIFFYFSTEARAYALVLGGAGLSMVCWQAAVSSLRRGWSLFGLWFGLALAIDVHSFAIFLMVPFTLAQVTRDFIRRKPDWPAWTAIALFPLGLLPVLPGQRAASHFYGSHFWSRPQLGFLLDSYSEVFTAATIFLIALLVFAGCIAFMRQTGSSLLSEDPETSGFTPPEWMLVIALALTPLYAVPASFLLHVYRPQYVIFYCIGFVLCVFGILAELALRSRAAGAVLLAIIGGLFLIKAGQFVNGVKTLLHPTQIHRRLQAEYDAQPWIELLENSALPIVPGDHLLFTQLSFYGPADLEPRLFYLTDFRNAAKYPQSITGQLNFLLYGKELGWQTMDIAQFLPSHRRFLFALGFDSSIWLPPYLMQHERAGDDSLRLLGPVLVPTQTEDPGSRVKLESYPIYDVLFNQLPTPAPAGEAQP